MGDIIQSTPKLDRWVEQCSQGSSTFIVKERWSIFRKNLSNPEEKLETETTEKFLYQGSLADCYSYLRLKETNQIVMKK